MIQELVNTSVPAGLFPSTEGFCTVACTQSMPASIRAQLELMGGYRVLWKAGDPNVDRNPLLLSHYRLLLGGCFYDILSRIAVCGVDHQGRLNRIAHHLILHNVDHIPQGPAALLQDGDIIFRTWDKPPQFLPDGRIEIRQEMITPQVCRTWEKYSGDAGWAGELVQSAVNDPSRSNYIIYDTGMDAVALLNEAFSLVPVSRRWDITFSTHFDILPPKVDTCTWRFCVAGSRTAGDAHRNATGMVIDLTSKLDPAEDHFYARVARTGNDRQAANPEITYAATHHTAKKTPAADAEKHREPTPAAKYEPHVTPRRQTPGPGNNSVKNLLGAAAIIVIIIEAIIIAFILNAENTSPAPKPEATIQTAADSEQLREQVEKLKAANDELDRKLAVAENLQKSQAAQIKSLQQENERLRLSPAAAATTKVKTPVKTSVSAATKKPVQTPAVKAPSHAPAAIPADGYVPLEQIVPTQQFKKETNGFTVQLPGSDIEKTPLLAIAGRLPEGMAQSGNSITLTTRTNFGTKADTVVDFSSSADGWTMNFHPASYGQDNCNLAGLKKFETVMQYSAVRIGSDEYQFIKPAARSADAGSTISVAFVPLDMVAVELVSNDMKIEKTEPTRWNLVNPVGIVFAALYSADISENTGKFTCGPAPAFMPDAITGKLADKTVRFDKVETKLIEQIDELKLSHDSAKNLSALEKDIASRLDAEKNETKKKQLSDARRLVKSLRSLQKDIDTLSRQLKWLGGGHSFKLELKATQSGALLDTITINYKKQ